MLIFLNKRKFLFVTLFLLLALISLRNSTAEINESNNSFSLSSITYEDHSIIAIDGNNDFITQGWDEDGGDGTESSPYRINGLKITSTTPGEILISIKNTDEFFIIEDCLLIGQGTGTLDDNVGIMFEHVKNGQIRNNIINKTTNGIELYQGTSSEYTCEENIIIGNTIHNISRGIGLNTAFNNYIEDNAIYNINYTGISLSTSNNILITKNHIYNSNFGTGIYYYKSNNTIIASNDIHDHSIGIRVLKSQGNEFCGNSIVRNNGDGILLDNSNTNLIWNSGLAENFDGINLISESKWNGIRNNNISGNIDYGVRITHTDCTGNNVTSNNFLLNNPGQTSQALDNGDTNLFAYNYWTDLTGSDANSDGYIDTPYQIAGSANNQDQMPSADGISFSEDCPKSSAPRWNGATSWPVIAFICGLVFVMQTKRKRH